MKLDAGQATAPVPWPIQSIPTASARNPVVSSNLRMDIHSLCRPAGCHAGCEARAAGGRISGSNTMTAASARPPHEGQDNYSDGGARDSQLQREAVPPQTYGLGVAGIAAQIYGENRDGRATTHKKAPANAGAFECSS